MDNLVLQLSLGREKLAELVLQPQAGPTPMTVNYSCTLDGDSSSTIVIEGVPKRADPLQVAVDALHLLRYQYSGRKLAGAKKTRQNPPSQLVATNG